MYDIIADASTILSHFSEFSWIKLKDYQTKIEDIYKQQETRMKNFLIRNISTLHLMVKTKRHIIFSII